jgi:DNA helicase INO80
VQSISVLAYLIEKHDIWGPFLVIAPSSTLFNWQQELARFVPKVKALPYWGTPKERALLRKFWSKKELSYNEDAHFNVLITSYQMVCVNCYYVIVVSVTPSLSGCSGRPIFPTSKMAVHDT